MQRSCADVNSLYKRKCWTNSGGPLVNYSEIFTHSPTVQTEYCDRRLAGTGSRYRAPFSLVKFFREKDFVKKNIKLNQCGHCVTISIVPSGHHFGFTHFLSYAPCRYLWDFSRLRYNCRAGLFGNSLRIDLLISPRIFEKIRNEPSVIFRGLGEDDSWKKIWSKNLGDTVPLSLIVCIAFFPPPPHNLFDYRICRSTCFHPQYP
jgi:hypothetical protein